MSKRRQSSSPPRKRVLRSSSKEIVEKQKSKRQISETPPVARKKNTKDSSLTEQRMQSIISNDITVIWKFSETWKCIVNLHYYNTILILIRFFLFERHNQLLWLNPKIIYQTIRQKKQLVLMMWNALKKQHSMR